MEKFKEVEIEQGTTEDVIEHGGLERLEKELKKSTAEKRKRQTKEKIDFGGLEIQGQEAEVGQKQAPKEKSPEGLAEEVLKMTYYDPDAWEKLREQSQETYEKTLLKKSESLAERYLAGTATAEETLLLDELKTHNQGELTDVWIKESKNYLVEKISSHRHHGKEQKYDALEAPPEILESWLIRTDPKKFMQRLRSNDYVVYFGIADAMSEIANNRFRKITKLKTIVREGDADQMEEAVKSLLIEKEITSKIMEVLGSVFDRSFWMKLLNKITLTGPSKTDLEFEKLKRDYKKLIKN